MNALAVIQSNDLLAIMSVGEDLSKKIQSNSSEMINAMDRAIKQNDDSFIKSINKILSKIDIEEISSFNNRKNGLQNLVEKVKNTKKKIEEKYTSIVKELGSIESTALQWRAELKDINTMLQSIKDNNISTVADFYEIKEQLMDEVDRLDSVDKTTYSQEKRNIIMQKINDVNLKIQTLEQLSSTIDVALKTNYNNYKKVISVYDTTIPMIESQVSIKSTTVYHRILAEKMKHLDNVNNKLITSTAQELIKAGEESIQLLNDTSNFEALKSAKKIIEDGKLMLAKREEEQILKLEAGLNQLKLEGKC